MDAALLAVVLPAYTSAVVVFCRYYWAHRCAECAYRRRDSHRTGRHRATHPARAALPAAAPRR